MASATGNNDGDVNQTAVFIATSLDTRLVTTVSGSDTVSDFKKKIMAEHLECYPAIGNIIVHSLKVKRRGIFYNLSDSILIKSAFGTTKGNWFMFADASSLTQDIDILQFNKRKVGDELALPLVTNNDSFVKKTVPFENQIVSKNPEEGMLSDDKKLDISKGSNSKKRARDVNNESLLNDPLECGLVKKKRKTTEVELESKSKKGQNVDHCHHLEDTSKNVIVSEVFKVNNEVDITNDDFAPGDQPNKTGSIDNQKDAKKPKKKNSKSEGLVKAKKNNKSSLMGPPDLLSKDQSTEVDLESKKSQRVDHVDHHHHLEDASKNVIVSEVFKVNNEVDIANDDFAPGDQPNKTGSIDNQKDAKKPKKKISKNEGLVKAKKNNKSSLTGPPDLLSKDRSTEVELESNKKSQSVDHVDHHHHLEDASKNVIVSEVSKVNNEVDVTNDDFAPGDQPNKIGSIDNKKDAKKPKKKTNEGLVKAKKNDKLSLVGPQDQLSKDQSTEVDLESKKSQSVDHCHSNEAGSQEINFMDYFSSGHQPNKTASIENRKDTKKPKKIISKIKNKKVDADSSSSSQSFRISFHHQKSNKQQAVVGPAGNNLLKTPAKIFGDYESDESSADDNASLNSDSGTRTPSRNPSSPSSSSSEDRSYAMKRKEDGGKNSIMSQNKLKKNMSMSDLFRSSSRFKKAKLTASQTEDNESQPVDFVPDSQPLA